jgi:hypothetical protein
MTYNKDNNGGSTTKAIVPIQGHKNDQEHPSAINAATATSLLIVAGGGSG